LPTNRRHQRIPFDGSVRLAWEDEQGQIRYASGKCIDVSEVGLRIEVSEPVPLQTYVTLRADRINVSGMAVVKHVGRRSTRFILGLELSQQMRDQAFAKLLDLASSASG
jgi:hypothetical protein